MRADIAALFGKY